MSRYFLTYNTKGEILYSGLNSSKAEEVAINSKEEGTVHFKTYHRIGSFVAINDHIFEKGQQKGKSLSYFLKDEIDILLELLGHK